MRRRALIVEKRRGLFHPAQMPVEEKETAVRRPPDRLEQVERFGHLRPAVYNDRLWMAADTEERGRRRRAWRSTSRSTLRPRAKTSIRRLRSLPTRRRSKRSSTPHSGRACAARKATRRRSRSRISRRSRRGGRCCSSVRFRSRRRRSPRSRLLSSARASISASGSATASCPCGARRRTIPVSCFVLEVNAPGLLVVKHHRGEESGKYVNVAVLEGDHLKMIDERASSLPDCPPLLASLLGFDAPASWAQSLNVLVQLAASMRAHKRGGALLVVPSGRGSVARVDRAADSLCHPPVLLGTRRADEPPGSRAAPLAGSDVARRRHRRRA